MFKNLYSSRAGYVAYSAKCLASTTQKQHISSSATQWAQGQPEIHEALFLPHKPSALSKDQKSLDRKKKTHTQQKKLHSFIHTSTLYKNMWPSLKPGLTSINLRNTVSPCSLCHISRPSKSITHPPLKFPFNSRDIWAFLSHFSSNTEPNSFFFF